MKLALGVVFIWSGSALIYLAVHGLEAATPWQAFTAIIDKIRDTDTTSLSQALAGGVAGGIT